MLAHQLPDLPPHAKYIEAMKEFFDWLEGRAKTSALPAVPTTAGENVLWKPPPTVYAWGRGIPLEPIRFAGANYLCVEIDYEKSDGQRISRTIEPYALRQTHDNRIILHAYDRDRGAHRSFRVDRLLGVHVTHIPFTPKYQVEFTQMGVRDIKPTEKSSSATI